MKNVPYHTEVVRFCQDLCNVLQGDSAQYQLACEHEHSCLILIAKKKFHIEGQWHTWIDYPKFFELLQTGQPFTSMDYVAPTPDWAVYGAEERGFDPDETRHYRKQRT
eukprot:NODE_2215_length_964_cov_162.925683_g1824_i0.p3 GENE.NODE_2215_length_964_cov_162.925683_g1824_i0~~NODE_2215_length_964_cov_162.925683_g1824_i0.p3  ORF type:complete len:108 (-),score=27.12 NODE_2215_length_964_cov_162.925683_g1824_i0:102-425(-)